MTETDTRWWTPTGWAIGPRPPEVAEGDEQVLSDEAITEPGKKLLPELVVETRPDGILFCDLIAFYSNVELFYVSQEHAAEFMARWREVLADAIREPSAVGGA
jgi:hypothetical protein